MNPSLVKHLPQDSTTQLLSGWHPTMPQLLSLFLFLSLPHLSTSKSEHHPTQHKAAKGISWEGNLNLILDER